MNDDEQREQHMQRNHSPEWVGIDEMVRRQRETLEDFRRWAARSAWHTFHAAKYDWWAYPIDRQSQFSNAYTVFADEVDALKATPGFLDNLRELARLQLLAYGWDLHAARSVPERGAAQRFEGATKVARLEKCARSLQLFGLCEEFRSVQAFAQLLIGKGVAMHWRSRDYADWWMSATCRSHDSK